MYVCKVGDREYIELEARTLKTMSNYSKFWILNYRMQLFINTIFSEGFPKKIDHGQCIASSLNIPFSYVITTRFKMSLQDMFEASDKYFKPSLIATVILSLVHINNNISHQHVIFMLFSCIFSLVLDGPSWKFAYQ